MEVGVQVDLSTEPCSRFLKMNVGKKVDVVLLYVDVYCLTRLSLQLPDRKLARIMQLFAQEMSLVITSHEGYVFNYVGDAVIALFPIRDNVKKASEDAIDCSKTMNEVLKYVNLAFNLMVFPVLPQKSP